MSPSTKQGLDSFMNRAQPSSYIVLLNAHKRRGRMLEENIKDLKVLQNRLIPTHSWNEVSHVLSTILTNK